MDLRVVLRVVVRQWYIVFLVLLATVAAAVLLGREIDPEYEAKSAIVLLNASTTVGEDGEVVRLNPYSRMGGSEVFAANALVNVSSSQPFAKRLVVLGIEGEYKVGNNPQGGGAILDIYVTSTSAEDALNDLETLTAAVQEELASRQERTGAPKETWITSDLLTWPNEATPLFGSRVRVYGAIGILGIVGSISLAFLVDLLRHPRRVSESEIGPSLVAGAQDVRDDEADLDLDLAEVASFRGRRRSLADP